MVRHAVASELAFGEELHQNHEHKAPEAFTEFLACHAATEELRPLATVWWNDGWTAVRLLQVTPSDREQEASKNALVEMVSS